MVNDLCLKNVCVLLIFHSSYVLSQVATQRILVQRALALVRVQELWLIPSEARGLSSRGDWYLLRSDISSPFRSISALFPFATGNKQ